MLERLKLRARALLRARSLEAELDEELRYHLEAEAARFVARGMSPDEAARAARRAFGNPTQLKEEIRDGWGRRGLERLGQDARYAWRSFRRAPAFALTIVGTIALALGLNTMAFTIFDAYVLRPVAVRDPTSLYQVATAPGARAPSPGASIRHSAPIGQRSRRALPSASSSRGWTARRHSVNW
jgi:hypothetical protein